MFASGQQFLFPDTLSAAQQARKTAPAEKEPVLVSLCFLGVPCRWHGRRAKRRDALLAKLKEKYVIAPVCPEQLGGMPTPRTSETLRGGTGSQALDDGRKLLAPGTNEDVTEFHIKGSYITLEIAQQVGARRAYLKGGSPSCDKDALQAKCCGVAVFRYYVSDRKGWRLPHASRSSLRRFVANHLNNSAMSPKSSCFFFEHWNSRPQTQR